MPARSVSRPTLGGRFSNLPASNPATIAAAQLNQGAPNATAQTGAGPVAATRAAPPGFQGTGYSSTVQMPRNVTFTAPNGAKGIIQLSSNGRAKITSNPQYTEPITEKGKVIGTGTFDTAIVNGKLASQIIGFKGNTLTEPINSTTNTSIGTITEKGTINYTYALKGSELVPEITAEKGGIFYQSPHRQSQYSKAQQAYETAESNLAMANKMENITIPNTINRANAAFAKNENSYGNALINDLQGYNQTVSQLLWQPAYNTGQFAGYNTSGLLSVSKSIMNANKPVEVAQLTTTGLKPLVATVSDAIYGNVSGKSQKLGTLLFTPTVNNGTLSLTYTGFKPSEVQVSGQGWYAGIYTSFNPNTGQITVNPKNYAYVTENMLTETLPNGEIVQSMAMPPSGFGIYQAFNSDAFNYLNVANIPVTNGQYNAIESYTSNGNKAFYTLTNPGTFGEIVQSMAMPPSGFGIYQAFNSDAFNYLNVANIPVTNGQYNAIESYTSNGNKAFYTLTNPGTFPAEEITTTYLGKGVTQTQTYTRQFNPQTGAISYMGASGFSIPGVGSVSVPTSGALSETYTYKGKQYTFNFNPAMSEYSITGNIMQSFSSSNPAMSVINPAVNVYPSVGNTQPATEYVQYNFAPTGGVTGYNLLSPSGKWLGGASYITPKPVAEGNVNQPALVGNTLILPPTEYASYISNVNSNIKSSSVSGGLAAQYAKYSTSSSQINSILETLLPAMRVILPSEEYAGWSEFMGGEQAGQGYALQGAVSFGKGLAIGEAPVFVVAAPVASLTNAGISVAAQAATNVVTGKPITNNLLLAGSLGADFGSILGATIPEGASAVNVAKTVGLNAVKMGAGYGTFNLGFSLFEAAFGGNPATSSGATGGISPRSQVLGAAAKSQSSFSLLGNYTPSEYLNIGVSSFMQGFTTGTEFAGAFGAAQNELAAYAKSSTAAKTALRLIQNKPLVSGTMGTFTFGTTLASGGTLRQAVVGGVASSAFMYGFMGLSEQFNPRLKLGAAEEPSTVIAIRPGPEEEARGTVITGAKEYNDMILSANQQYTIKNAALKVDLNNLKAQSDIIAKTLGVPKPSVEVTSEGMNVGGVTAAGLYNPTDLTITINPEQPEWTLPNTLIHENLHSFFENGNLEIVRSYKLTPSAAKDLNSNGYASVSSFSAFKQEGATFDLTSRILNGNDAIYLSKTGEFTNIGYEDQGLLRTNQYGSLEYRKAVNTPFKNGNILDTYTGVTRTLTAEANPKAPEESLIFKGGVKVERTITINPTRIQRFFGKGPKVITQDFFTETPEYLSTLIKENPSVVVGQPGGIETTPELSDVYKTAGVKPAGPTTMFHQSIATPLGQEWLGEAGNAEDFNLVGKTSKFVLLEVGPNEPLPSTEELFAGYKGEIEGSPYEGPKPTAIKPFDLGEGAKAVPSAPEPAAPEASAPAAKGETQIQVTKTMPTSQIGSASSIFSARIPAYVNAGSEAINVFPLVVNPARTAPSIISEPQSIFREPTVAPTNKPVSISGVDPYALYNTQRQNSITNTTRRSNLNPLGNMLYRSSRANLLFGSRVGLSNKTAYGISTTPAASQKLSQKQSQKQTQKQSQKQTQKNAYRNPPPTMTPPPIPNYLYGAFAPDQRFKPPKPKAQKAAPPQKGTFKYINDLTSAMFNLHGSKKNKVYESLGFFRPL